MSDWFVRQTLSCGAFGWGGTLVNFDNVGVRLVTWKRTASSCGPKGDHVAWWWFSVSEFSYIKQVDGQIRLKETKLACMENWNWENRLFHEDHARGCQEIEELRRICCQETDQARQARIEELFMLQQRNPTTLSQMMAQNSGFTEQSKFLVPRSWSNFHDSEFQKLAALRFWIAAKYTELYGCHGKRFVNYQWIWHLHLKIWDLIFQRQQGVIWKGNRWIRRFKHVTSKVEVEF